jgi:hypothetical protein
MIERPSNKHSLRRTSPKGGPFIGTCFLCGTPNLTLENMQDECPNQRGLTQDQAVVEAVLGEDDPGPSRGARHRRADAA